MFKLPNQVERLLREFSEFAAKYKNLSSSVYKSSALNENIRTLIKLGISIRARMEGAVHAQVRKALKLILKKNEIRQTAILSIPAISFPSAMAASSWIDNIIDKKKRK